MSVDSSELVAVSRASDFLELTKPRITVMVVLTVLVGYVVAGGAPAPVLLLALLVGSALLAGGASALNELVEREHDALMARTRTRPLPAGRLDAREALVFGAGIALAGNAILLAVGPLTAALGAATLLSYLFVYTPLKRRTPWCTAVGAVPGALPVVMGWSAAGRGLDAGAWVLFGILFLWQLPHFYAIAWLFRRQYAEAGFRMLPVVDPHGARTSRQILATSALLLATSLAPSAIGLAGVAYAIGAAALGAVLFAFGVQVARTRSEVAARRLLLASVVYLPALFTLLVSDRTSPL